jgi:hypothetical protein
MSIMSQASQSKRFAAAAAIAGFAALLASPVLAKTQPVSAVSSQDQGDDMSAQQESDVRLALDKVELDADSGKLDEAYSLVTKLKAKYPGNPDVIAAAADIEDRMSNRSTSASELCLPNSLEPNNNDLLTRDNQTRNSACAGYNRRITPEGYEQIESVTGQIGVLSPSMSVIYDLENDHMNTSESFTRVNGNEESFYGMRQQGTVTLEKTFMNHDQAGVSIYGDNNTAGGGLQNVMRDRGGNGSGTSIMANFQQPNWDYVEMIVENGTKSDIVLERKQIITSNLQASLSGNYTSYALENASDVANAPGWNFDLDFSHPVKFFNQGANDPTWMGDEFTFGAHYAVEAQYISFVDRHDYTATDNYKLLPTTSYEIHSFTASLGKTIFSNVDAEMEGGYGVDRISGSSGPVYGGSLTYTPIQHLGVDVHAMRTLLGGQNNGQKEDLLGAALKYMW